ncbi:hypothetical protein WDU94_008196 [Cyamophila willieti]
MLRCFKCRKEFDDTVVLIKHLRLKCAKNNRSNLCCGQPNCYRYFSEINSLKRHLIRMHVSQVRNSSPDSSFVTNSQESTLVAHSSFEIPTDVQLFCSVSSFQNPICSNLGDIVTSSLSELSAKLYSNPQVPRSVVQTVMSSIESFSLSYSEGVVSLVKNVLSHDQFSNQQSTIANTLKKTQSNLAEFNSDYKRLQYFEKLGSFIKAREVQIGSQFQYDYKNGYHSVPYVMHVVPLSLVLQNVFAMNGFFDSCLEYVRSLENNPDEPIMNIMQGSTWKKMKREMATSEDVLHLPMIVYYDDFEVNNPLGAHAGIHKIGGLYISLPFLPRKYVSLIDHILILALFHTSDREKFGNKMVFNHPINELNFLRDKGVPVTTASFKGQVKLHVVALTGDNLGLNGMLGFVESFSAHFYCRICKSSKSEIQKVFREDSSKLRTMESYNADLALNNCSQTGIKSECIWFELEGFHLFDNVAVDLLHDFFHGCCCYTMDFMLKYLVQDSKIISLSSLETKIVNFFYGPDSGSKPINAITIEGGKIKCKTSASEMRNLVTYFGVMIGSEVPIGDSNWELFLLLRQILDKLVSPRVFLHTVLILEHLISDFIKTFCRITGSNVKPKFHFLIHYPKMLEKFGSAIQTSTFRFEAKHQISKIAARGSKNRKNITYTLVTRNQLTLNYKFLQNESPITFKTGKKFLINSKLLHYLGKVQHQYTISLDSLSLTHWLLLNGIKLVKSDLVTIDLSESTCMPIFGKILHIFVPDDSEEFYLQCCMFKTLYFDNHYHAYVVTLQEEEFLFIKSTDLYSLVPNTLTKTESGLLLVTLRDSID